MSVLTQKLKWGRREHLRAYSIQPREREDKKEKEKPVRGEGRRGHMKRGKKHWDKY